VIHIGTQPSVTQLVSAGHHARVVRAQLANRSALANRWMSPISKAMAAPTINPIPAHVINNFIAGPTVSDSLSRCS
jgi:hypothetical protein